MTTEEAIKQLDIIGIESGRDRAEGTVPWGDADTEALRHLASEAHRAALLTEALTPSGETKAEYIGEFETPFRLVDEQGDEETIPVMVSWTTIKTIMAAIAKRAKRSLDKTRSGA